MDTKYKVGIAVIAVAVSFAAGRYSVPEKKIEVSTDKKEETKQVEVQKDKKKNTKVVEIINKDGSKEITTTIDEETSIDKKSTDAKKEDSSVSVEVVSGSSKVTISALGGLDTTTGIPLYGASVSKPILGPVTIGIWGLSNLSCGASIGLTF